MNCATKILNSIENARLVFAEDISKMRATTQNEFLFQCNKINLHFYSS